MILSKSVKEKVNYLLPCDKDMDKSTKWHS